MATSHNPLVQLNYASLDLLSDETFYKKILGWLSVDERKRHECFANQQQADQYLLARSLLRSQLSKRVPGVMCHEWVFVVDDYGKPRLADEFSHLNLHFNLSHSEELVVLALGEGVSLGVDVECIHRPVFSMNLARRYFSKFELADLERLTDTQQAKRIAQLWTLKESYLKACGLGIRMPLAKLEFGFETGHGLNFNVPSSLVQSVPAKENRFIGLFRLGSDYSLALTIYAEEKINTSSVEISEWGGLDGSPSGLPCELLRKTGVKASVEKLYKML